MKKIIEENLSHLVIDEAKIGLRLYTLRESLGLSLSELGERLDVPKSNLWNYENGTLPSIRVLTEYVKFFRVPLEYILYGISTDEEVVTQKVNAAKTFINVTNKKSYELDRKRIGAYLKQLRITPSTVQKNKLSQEKLAGELEDFGARISQKMLSDIETGKKLPKLDVLIAYQHRYLIGIESIIYR